MKTHRKTDYITSFIYEVTCVKLDFTMLVFQLSLVCRFSMFLIAVHVITVCVIYCQLEL